MRYFEKLLSVAMVSTTAIGLTAGAAMADVILPPGASPTNTGVFLGTSALATSTYGGPVVTYSIALPSAGAKLDSAGIVGNAPRRCRALAAIVTPALVRRNSRRCIMA